MEKTINGEQLVTALEYIIWLEASRQRVNLHPDKEHELADVLKGWNFRVERRVTEILHQHDFPTDAWQAVLGRQEDNLRWSRYMEFVRLLNTTVNLANATFDLEAVAQLLEPELARYAVILPDSRQKWQFLALLSYLHAFASGEVTERDLLAA